MKVRRQELPVVLFSAAYMAGFLLLSLGRQNYEFVLYSAVVIVLAAWIFLKQPALQFDGVILWGLSLWGLMHMSGGNLRVGDDVLYNVQLIPRVLRYDQFVHAFGFGTATLVCFHVLRGFLRPDFPRSTSLVFMVAMMGCGLGAVNEILEYIAVRTVPETNVGGYDNTLWDLIFNFMGSLAAAIWTLKMRPSLDLKD